MIETKTASKRKSDEEIETGQLNFLRATRKHVTITFVHGGESIRCAITGFTTSTIKVTSIAEPFELILYKHAIASIEYGIGKDDWAVSLVPREKK